MKADTLSTLELRPYQRDALDRTHAALARGVNSQLGVAATGLGKTIIFCALARERGGRTLVIVHRDELVRQAWAKVRESWPGVEVGIVKAGENDIYAQVVVASVQTLSRDRRLGQLTGAMVPNEGGLGLARLADPFTTVIVDEAHHAHADSYRKVLDALNAGQEDGPLLLGVTATPDRGDGHGLDDVFAEIVWNYDILWGIRSGFLCDVRAKRVTIDTLNLDNVKTSRGDYEQGSVGRALEDADAPAWIVQAWKQHASDRRTLVFMPTVALANAMCDTFRHAGVAAAWVSGDMSIDQRRMALDQYSSGVVQVLVNCMVLTEGYDEPRTDCVIQARPTKNRALFTQMIGRGTRKHPDKVDLLVLDVAGSSETLSLVTVPSLLGIPREFTDALGDGSGLLSDVAQAFDDHQVKAGRMNAEDADLFRTMRGQKIAWVQTHEAGERRRYVVQTGKENPVVVVFHREPSRDDGWLCGLNMPEGEKRVLIADVSLELAQGVGEDAVRKLTGGSTALVDPDALWRKSKPSQKARAAAHKWRLPHPEKYKTAGELSDALTAHIERKKSQPKRAGVRR